MGDQEGAIGGRMVVSVLGIAVGVSAGAPIGVLLVEREGGRWLGVSVFGGAVVGFGVVFLVGVWVWRGSSGRKV